MKQDMIFRIVYIVMAIYFGYNITTGCIIFFSKGPRLRPIRKLFWKTAQKIAIKRISRSDSPLIYVIVMYLEFSDRARIAFIDSGWAGLVDYVGFGIQEEMKQKEELRKEVRKHWSKHLDDEENELIDKYLKQINNETLNQNYP